MPVSLSRRGPLLAVALVAAVIASSSPQLVSRTPAFAGGSACTSLLDVVAHPDDDLLFQSPDLVRSIQQGSCVTTAYITSGDDGKGLAYAESREEGVESAYSEMAGIHVDPASYQPAGDWTRTTATLAGKTVTKATLTSPQATNPNLTLYFFRLPDGGYPTMGTQNLKGLDQGAIGQLSAIDAGGDPARTFTKTQLIASLLALMTASNADTVRTQDYTGTYGDGYTDHTDHHAVALLTRTASNQYGSPHTLAGYEDYETQSQGANVTGSDLAAKQSAFYAYTPHDALICRDAAGCAGSTEALWLQRQYVADGPLSQGPVTATTDLALAATATASSQNLAGEQVASVVNDGSTLGATAGGGTYDAEHEWVSADGSRGVGASITLTWPFAITTDHVTLFDRPDPDDQVLSGTLAFSDGSAPVAVGALANVPGGDGQMVGTDVTFAARTITSITFTIGSVSGTTQHAGLAELQVWPATSAPATTAPPTSTPTASAPTASDPTGPSTPPTGVTPPSTGTTTPTQPAPPTAPTRPTLPAEKGSPKVVIKDTTLTTKQFVSKGVAATFTGLTAGKRYQLSYANGDSGAVVGSPLTASSKGVITGTWKPNTKAAPALAHAGAFQLRLVGTQTSASIGRSFTVKDESHLTWSSAHRSGKHVTFHLVATRASTGKAVAWRAVTASIQKKVGSSWRTVAVAKASSKGVLTKSVTAGTARWRVVIAASGSTWGVTSRIITR